MIRWETIKHESAGATLVCVLDRAEKRNALTPQMLREIASIGTRVRADSTLRNALLTGAGDVFCAGFDLSLCRDDSGAMATLLADLSHAARALRALPIPVTCAAPGAAIAGGCALLTACDFAITDTDAKIGYPVVRLGLSPAVSAPALAPTIGLGPARERLLDPHLIRGADALRLGLVVECVATRDAVRPRAESLCAELAAKPAHGLSATKRWLAEIDGSLDVETHAGALAVSLATARSDEYTDLLAQSWKGP